MEQLKTTNMQNKWNKHDVETTSGLSLNLQIFLEKILSAPGEGITCESGEQKGSQSSVGRNFNTYNDHHLVEEFNEKPTYFMHASQSLT